MENKETYNINYGYTTFLAFLMYLRFNNSRKIEIEILLKYPELLLEALKGSEKDNYNIIMGIDDNSFYDFLKLNKEIFTIDDKYVCLNEKVSINDLNRVLETYNFPFTSSAIHVIRFDNSLKESLKLNGIRDTLNKFYNVEDKIKSYYLSYAYGLDKPNYPEKIKILLEKRNDFYSKLALRSKDYVGDCHSEVSTIDRENPFEYFYPVDNEIDYDEMFPDAINLVDEVLNDVYMFTIFIETSNPSKYRMYEDVNGLDLKYAYNIDVGTNDEYRREFKKRVMKNSIQTGKLIFTPRTRSQMLFYLGYIKCINELLDKLGDNEELKLIKYKLIYLLDDNSLNLINEDNIDREYDRLYKKYLEEKQYSKEEAYETFDENDDINIDPFELDWFQVLIKAFIIDLFEGQLYDEMLTYKKLAMIRTYYLITKDEEIMNLMNNYSDHPKFWEYMKYIRNGKQLIKK
ncbi:MAG: hypothetical protein IJK67_05590 [Bacilli bacterium]|nr:hypothetical protein [Bacilli bacterium]